MEKYNVICYRLHRSVKPAEVISALDMLMEKYSFFCSECLFGVKVNIFEFEYEGKLHSNRNKNAVNTILKHCPELKQFYKYNCEHREDGVTVEDVSISNFFGDDYTRVGDVEYNLVCDIMKCVPRPYSVNSLDLIYNGIGFNKESIADSKIENTETNLGAPKGNYIWYERTNYGTEKHSYISFSVDDNKIELMRRLYFDFTQMVPGKYVGTEFNIK